MTKVPTVLITGVNGLIGGRIFERLSPTYNVVGSSRNQGQYVSSEFDLADLTRINSWLNHIKPNIIINCAGVTAIAYAEENQIETDMVNVQAVTEMVKWSKSNHCKLIQFSTDFVFDGKKKSYVETDAPNPKSFYAKSKYQSEQIALGLSNSVIIRTSLVYGYYIGISRLNFPLWIVSELQQKHTLSITADQFRSPTYVVDLAEGVLGLLSHSFSGIIHIAGKERVGVFQFAKTVTNIFQLDTSLLVPIDTVHSGISYHRPLSSALSINLAKNGIYYNPRSLHDSLLQMKQLMNSKRV